MPFFGFKLKTREIIIGEPFSTPQPVVVSAPHLVSSMLLQLLVELQGDANHHFSFIPVGVGDVVQDAIKICGRDEHVMKKKKPMVRSATVTITSCSFNHVKASIFSK